MIEKVWYACYGSNLCRERFFCYIEGGRPVGASLLQKGCKNKQPPLKSEAYTIPSSLYFAQNSNNWGGGGVAFIDPVIKKSSKTLSRIYLISRDQFTDLVKQEQLSPTTIPIDFNQVMQEGSWICHPNAHYGKLLYLGEKQGYPIFTFTNTNVLQPYTQPGEKYLSVIIKGLQETHQLDKEGIRQYLSDKRGINKRYTGKQLMTIIENNNNGTGDRT